jgi:hypothetical protein
MDSRVVDDEGKGKENRRNGGTRSTRWLEGVTIRVLTRNLKRTQQQVHDPVADVTREMVVIDSEKKYIVTV